MKTCCTWVDCTNIATKPQIGSDGNAWANLCDAHAKEIDENLLDPKGILRCWVRAQGGAKAMGAKMTASGEIQRTVKLAGRLAERVRR